MIPDAGDGSPGSRWWAWTPSRVGWAELCARSTTAPLFIRIQTDKGEPTITELESQDSSTVTYGLTANPETTYWIELSTESASLAEFDFTVVLRPLNDDFERRDSLLVDSNLSHTSHNFFADVELNEPNHSVGSERSDQEENTVWWSFTSPAEVSTIAIETLNYRPESNRAPSLAVYQSDAYPTEADQVASNFSGNRNPFAFNVEPGKTYHLAMDSLKPFDQSNGIDSFVEFTFAIRRTSTITNDNFHKPDKISINDDPRTVDAIIATENAEGDPFIGLSPGHSSFWWSWDAPNYELEVIETPHESTNLNRPPRRVQIERDDGRITDLRIVDDQGQQWELSSDSANLLPHQQFGIDALQQSLPSGNDILNEPSGQISQIKSLVAEILGFRRCVTVNAEGKSENDTDLEMLIGVFDQPIGPTSQAIASKTNQLTFCASLDAQTYVIGLDCKLWANPRTYQIELSWAERRPANDDIEWASPIQLNVHITGNNQTATVDSDDPSHSSLSGPNSIWWQWTAQTHGNYRLEAETNDFPDDLLLSIYEMSPTNTSVRLEQIARNFQIASPGPNRRYPAMSSFATFRATADTTYFILIQGYNCSHGDVRLQLSSSSAPGNDDIAKAFPISSQEIIGNNLVATTEPDEPIHGSAYPGQTLWWTWVAPNNGHVEIKTLKSMNSVAENPSVVFAVYRGPETLSAEPFETLIPVTSNHIDRSEYSDEKSFVAEKNIRYYLAVNTRNGLAGPFSLSWELFNGHLLSNSIVANDRLKFDVGISPKLSNHFQIQASSDLKTWAPITEIIQALEESVTVELDLSKYGSSHFFRTIEIPDPESQQ